MRRRRPAPTHGVPAAALAIMIVAALVPAAFAASWTVVKKKSAHGAFAVLAVDAVITQPRALAVEFVHAGGYAVWECTKGLSSSTWKHHYAAGLHQLQHVSGKGLCNVTASASGAGPLTVEILKAG